MLLIFFIAYIGPILITQMTEIANTSVDTVGKMKESAKLIFYQVFNLNLDKEIEQRLFDIVQQATGLVSKNAIDVISFLTRTAVVLAVIPFIVFYLLKDDDEFANDFLKIGARRFWEGSAKNPAQSG